MGISVAEAAERLQLDPSRVRRLLSSGELAGHRVGRGWVVDGDALATAASRSRPGGRPLSAPRAWGALDLLAGGQAPWLPSVARSQVKSVLRRLAESDSDRWRASLRSRAERHRVVGHSSSIRRLVAHGSVVAAGPAAAGAAGLDLIAPGAPPQLYVDRHAWPALARSLNLRDERSAGMALVRAVDQPELVSRMQDNPDLRSMAIAADCLDDPDPRAVRAGWQYLVRHATALPRSGR